MSHFYALRKFSLLFAFLFSAVVVQAQRTASVTGNWSNPATWGGASVPTATDAVTINGAVIVTVDVANAECASLDLNYSGNTSATAAQLNFTSGGRLTVNGNITLGAGKTDRWEIDMTNGGTLIFNSFVVNNNGIFTPGTGTVEFRATNTLPSESAFWKYNNLTVNGGTTTASQDLTITGNVTISSGTFDGGFLTSGSSRDCKHSIAGNWTNNGTFSARGGGITFNGTSAQTIGGTSATAFNNLTLNNSAGATLTQNATVSGTLTLTAGSLTVSAGNTLRLTTPTAIASSGATRYVVTAANKTSGAQGFLQVDGITNAYTFPVGDGTNYLPITLTPTSASNFAVCAFQGITANGQPNGTAFTATQKSDVVDAVWTVNRLAGSGGVTMKTGWPAALEGSAFQTLATGQIGIMHHGSGWETAQGTGDNTANTATRSGVTTFSPFGVGDVSFVVLPVKFATFSASRTKETVVLRWETAMEDKNKGFYIQRNTNGNWQGIAFVPSKAINGNSASLLSYEYKDFNSFNGVSQYRILQEDIDGKTTFSEVRSVRGSEHSAALVVYPNPSPDGTVNLVLDNSSAKEVRVIDFMGRTVKEYRDISNNSLVIDRLRSGLYTVQVVDRSSSLVETVSVLVR